MSAAAALRVNGSTLLADPSGALFWPDRGVLAVADLHFEKGSALAAQGSLLPPYDTAATLDRLRAVIARHRPRRVIALGDSFHDAAAAARLSAADRMRLRALVDGQDWIWIAGNHDPAPPEEWGGRVEAAVTIGPLTFRHEAEPGGAGEVSGHYHPKASVRLRARRFTGRCFVGDGRRVILPAFGAYTGGLDVRDPAIAALFPRGCEVHLLGRRGVYRFPGSALSG